jgi:hypothetical protein
MSRVEGERLVETQNINLSLSVLGDVLSALSRNSMLTAQSSRQDATATTRPVLKPVPYRNSKLTYLLKDSLGGNSKTVMITTIRPTHAYYQQSMISLLYSSRAKNIRNRAVLNKETVGDAAISQWSDEIERLRARLEQRAREFDELLERQAHEVEENKALRYRLQQLTAANEVERVQLEQKLSQVIHNQAGKLTLHRNQFVVYVLQRRSIHWSNDSDG